MKSKDCRLEEGGKYKEARIRNLKRIGHLKRVHQLKKEGEPGEGLVWGNSNRKKIERIKIESSQVGTLRGVSGGEKNYNDNGVLKKTIHSRKRSDAEEFAKDREGGKWEPEKGGMLIETK